MDIKNEVAAYLRASVPNRLEVVQMLVAENDLRQLAFFAVELALQVEKSEGIFSPDDDIDDFCDYVEFFQKKAN